MRVMAIDFGSKRIGIATGNLATGLAFPWGVIGRVDDDTDISAIISQIEIQEVEILVVGMPFSMNGKVGPQANATAQFIQLLSENSPVNIQTWDERLTTVEASRRLRESNAKNRYEGIEDAIAASIILQAFLDSERSLSL